MIAWLWASCSLVILSLSVEESHPSSESRAETDLFEVPSAKAMASSFSLASWFSQSLAWTVRPVFGVNSEHWTSPLVSGMSVSEIVGLDDLFACVITCYCDLFRPACSSLLQSSCLEGLHRICIIGGVNGLQKPSDQRRQGRDKDKEFNKLYI